MSEFTLTSEQQAIIEEGANRLTISASAGSGKTSVLVWRYLKHVIEEGVDPRTILAVTYTVKAAEEMRRRIIRELVRANRSDLSALAESGPIGTIHSLCERLLSQNAISLGIDPNFQILSNSTANSWMMESIQSALIEESRHSRSIEKLIESEVIRLQKSNRSRSFQLLGDLLTAINRTIDGLRSAGKSIRWVEDQYRSSDSIIHLWREYFLQLVPEKGRPRIAKLGNAFEAVTEFQKIEALNWIGRDLKKLESEDERNTAEMTTAIAHVICGAWSAYERRCFQEQKLDFTGLERNTIRLLEDHPHIAVELRKKYPILIIDEAQDLNPIQHQIVNLLGIESEMMIGDANQSIFGFRHANPALFEQKYREDRDRKLMGLGINHRSAQGILEVVNWVSKYYWKKTVANEELLKPFDLDVVEPSPFARWPQEVELLPINTLDDKKDGGIELISEKILTMIREGEQPKDIAILVNRWERGRLLQERLKSKGVEVHITGGKNGLFPRLEARDLANILTALSDPLDDFSLLAVLRSPCVDLTFDSLAEIAMNRPVSACLESYQPKIGSDAEKLAKFNSWFIPLSQYADQLAAWEAIAEVFAQSGLIEAIAKRNRGLEMVANLRKLARIAAQESTMGALEFARSIREIQKIDHEVADAAIVDDGANVVAITTIHKAKGLEFPVVVLGEPNMNYFMRSSLIRLDANSGVFAYSPDSLKVPIAKLIEKQIGIREREEGLRLLYVAMTRAKRKLCLPILLKTSHEGPSKWLAQVPEIRSQLEKLQDESSAKNS